MRRRFKEYPEGKMSKDEFSVEIRRLRKESTFGKKQQNQVGADPRSVKASEEDFRSTNKELCEVIFGDKKTIEFDDIQRIKANFREDLWHYEFHTYSPDEETEKISIADFLRTLIVCLHGRKYERYLRRIE